MFKRIAATALMFAAVTAIVSAQAKKPGAKSVMNDITITTEEGVYAGKMELAVEKGVVSGKMHLTDPTEITGKVAGTSKNGVLTLEFPYRMTERQCDGTVRMQINTPAKTGPARGTMEAVGCGRDTTLLGTVELMPVPAKKK